MIDNIKLNGVNAVKTTKNDGQTLKSSVTQRHTAESSSLKLSIPSSLLEAALNIPAPDHQEKIAGIKTAMQQDNYKIDLESLAEAMIKNYI